MEKSQRLKTTLFFGFVLFNLVLIGLAWVDNLDGELADTLGYVRSTSTAPNLGTSAPAGETGPLETRVHRNQSTPTPAGEPDETAEPMYDVGDVGGLSEGPFYG